MTSEASVLIPMTAKYGRCSFRNPLKGYSSVPHPQGYVWYVEKNQRACRIFTHELLKESKIGQQAEANAMHKDTGQGRHCLTCGRVSDFVVLFMGMSCSSNPVLHTLTDALPETKSTEEAKAAQVQ